MGAPAPVRDDTVLALTTLGWKPAVSRRAADRALDELGPAATLEALIRAALRHCAAG